MPNNNPKGKGGFKEGNPGRPPGSKNKFTQLKEDYLKAFYSEELKGTEGLIEWAVSNKTTFYQIMTKLFPKGIELSGPDGGPIPTESNADHLTDEELAKIIADRK